MFSKSFIAIVLSLAPFVAKATVTPTSPDSTTSVNVGGTIEALWTIDSVDDWTDVEIQLMTGANLDMVTLATVATGIDGTTASSYSFTAPDVSPYSKIYFLQFTNGGNVTGATWTTRFTIAGSDSSTTTPTNTTDDVEWGTGVLLSEISNSTTSSSSSSTSASVTASESSSSSAESSTVSSTASASAASDAVSTTISTTDESTTASSSSTSTSSSSSSSSTSGAGRVEAGLFAVAAGAAFAALF